MRMARVSRTRTAARFDRNCGGWRDGRVTDEDRRYGKESNTWDM